jgi:trans-2,3-dihydro-3-hydroxyanthranilate isomerase
MQRHLDYTVLDVFAERPLEGNPLAVFHDGRGLSDAEMQAIARETNLSETTFVLPSGDPDHDRTHGVRVRIFTTQEELPFAGHPSLGTASWLHLHHPPLRGQTDIRLLLNVGPIAVRINPGASPDHSVHATMWQNDAVFGALHDRAEVARILGLEQSDLLEDAPPQTVSTGNAFCLVALRPEALARLAIPQREAAAWLTARQTRWFYCIAPGQDASTWRARCAIAWMVRHQISASGQQIKLLQGFEIGRPSHIEVRAVRDRDAIGSITVSGSTIPVARGTLFLPV